MAGSLFLGLNDKYTGYQSNREAKTAEKIAFPAVVLDVCTGADDGTGLYKSERDIGNIRMKRAIGDYSKMESQAASVAYPLDRSIARYPVPGEEVIVFKAFGDTSELSDKAQSSPIYFYSFVVSSMRNVTYNVDPFMATSGDRVDDKRNVSLNEVGIRFDVKLKDIDLVKTLDNKPKVYKQLRPYEGDFILQGRFGNSIRFGSTSGKISSPWAPTPASPGASGDGIMILRVDRDFTNSEKDMFTSEDINTDDAAIYLCTSQKIDLLLACASDFKSWRARFDIKPESSAPANNNITNTGNVNETWQRPVDQNQTIDPTLGNTFDESNNISNNINDDDNNSFNADNSVIVNSEITGDSQDGNQNVFVDPETGTTFIDDGSGLGFGLLIIGIGAAIIIDQNNQGNFDLSNFNLPGPSDLPDINDIVPDISDIDMPDINIPLPDLPSLSNITLPTINLDDFTGALNPIQTGISNLVDKVRNAIILGI